MQKQLLLAGLISLFSLGAHAALAQGPQVIEIASLQSPLNGDVYTAMSGGACPVAFQSTSASQNTSNLTMSHGHQVIFYGNGSSFSGQVSYSLSISAYVGASPPLLSVTFGPDDKTSAAGSPTITLGPTDYVAYPAALSGTANYSCPSAPSKTGTGKASSFGTYSGGPTTPSVASVTFTINPPS